MRFPVAGSNAFYDSKRIMMIKGVRLNCAVEFEETGKFGNSIQQEEILWSLFNEFNRFWRNERDSQANFSRKISSWMRNDVTVGNFNKIIKIF